MDPSDLIFIHLSDLHFRLEDAETEHDLDADVRNELLRDIAAIKERLPSVRGVLITGDIAFGGREGEYQLAIAWLRDLCETIGAPPDAVWVIPGNHDIEVPIVGESKVLRDIRQQFRSGSFAHHSEIDNLIRDCCTDPDTRDIILRPLTSYVDFAQRFECATSADQLAWEDDFRLNDGSILRIRGINSVLISDLTDNTANNKLVAGQTQSRPKRQDGVVHIVLCHHPPDWLLDQDPFETNVRRAPIQLFGHKHTHAFRQIDGCVRLHAGALHPERGDSWHPRYNVIGIRVNGTDQEREIQLTAMLREWDHEQTKFVPDFTDTGDEAHVHTAALDPWLPPTTTRGSEIPTRDASEEESTEASTSAAEVENAEDGEMISNRRLVYDFFSLPFNDQMRVIVDLKLLREDDKGLSRQLLLKSVFERVKNEGLAEQLRHELDKHLERRGART